MHTKGFWGFLENRDGFARKNGQTFRKRRNTTLRLIHTPDAARLALPQATRPTLLYAKATATFSQGARNRAHGHERKTPHENITTANFRFSSKLI